MTVSTLPQPERKLWFQDPQMVEFLRMNKCDAEHWAARLYEDGKITYARAVALLDFHVGAVGRFERKFPKPSAEVISIGDAS